MGGKKLKMDVTEQNTYYHNDEKCKQNKEMKDVKGIVFKLYRTLLSRLVRKRIFAGTKSRES